MVVLVYLYEHMQISSAGNVGIGTNVLEQVVPINATVYIQAADALSNSKLRSAL
jgi:hypothetical protein